MKFAALSIDPGSKCGSRKTLYNMKREKELNDTFPHGRKRFKVRCKASTNSFHLVRRVRLMADFL
jgi:hypothetical protein